jgi:uncharacterized protein
MLSHRMPATIASAMGLLAVVGVSQALGQSFNCRTADRPDEVLICQRPDLAALDSRMSSLFFRLRNSLAGSARGRLVDDRQVWLRGRIACGGDARCIREAYEQRIRELRQDY